MTLNPRNMLIPSLGLTLAALAVPTHGDTVINIWQGQHNFHHKVNGMPDMDQRREDLPNNGSCYCVPTSTMNMLMYAGNHGAPGVLPGPGYWGGDDNHDEVTVYLAFLGAMMDTSPGGDDPDDPDCDGGGEPLNGGDNGGDGECDSLGCGTSYGKAYDALQLWMGDEADDFIFTAKFLGNGPDPSFEAAAAMGFIGNTVAVAYGRYDIVGGDHNGIPILRRNGGHSITMNQAHADGQWNKTLFARDPAQDDGNINTASSFATKEYSVLKLWLARTSDPPGGFLENWDYAWRDVLDFHYEQDTLRILDGYLAFKPKTGYTTNAVGQILNLPLAEAGNPPVAPLDTPTGALVDLAANVEGTGYYTFIDFPTTNWTAIHEVGIMVDEDEDYIARAAIWMPDPRGMAVGRLGDLYILGRNSIQRWDTNTWTMSNEYFLSTQFGDPRGITYDDQTDTVYVLGAWPDDTGKLTSFPRTLDSEVIPIIIYDVDNVAKFPGDVRLSMNPTDGRIWAASAGSKFVYGMLPEPDGSASVDQLIALPHPPTSIEFEDNGHMHVAHNGSALYFTPDGDQWELGVHPFLNNVQVGPILGIERSRTNFDPAIHDTPEWHMLPADEVADIGLTTIDCPADCSPPGGNLVVNIDDLLAVIDAFSTQDLNCDIAPDNGNGSLGNGLINIDDLLKVIDEFGPCPE